jgi:hypothetical protein
LQQKDCSSLFRSIARVEHGYSIYRRTLNLIYAEL